MRRNLARLEAQCAALPADDPRRARNDAALARMRAELPALPKKRETRLSAVDIDLVHKQRPLEKNVLAEILQALRHDPRVGFVWRQTSGVFREGDRYIRTGPKGLPDVCGVLLGTGRAFFIEAKRDDNAKPDALQAERLQHFRRIGAIAGVAWSAESALALLP